MSVLLPCSAHLLHLCYSVVPCRCDSCSAGAPVALFCAMSGELITCELTCVSLSSEPEETLNAVKSRKMDCEQPIFSVLSGGVKEAGDAAVPSSCGGGGGGGPASPTATTSDTESGIFSGECELCVEHESELDWFCGTEQKLICSHCAIVGSCHGHTVTPLATRVTAVRVSVRGGSCSVLSKLFAYCVDFAVAKYCLS